MQWVRQDTALPRNHKILALLAMPQGHRAYAVWSFGMCYVGEQETDGFVPREALPLIHGRAQDAARLVDVGLWHEDPGGWMMHDWAERNPTSAEIHERTVRARAAAAKRWSKGNDPPALSAV